MGPPVDITRRQVIVAIVIGFRWRGKLPPDLPGDPKIFLPRIVFLIPGSVLLCWGLWEAWQYFRLPESAGGGLHGLLSSINEMNLAPRTVAGVCAAVFIAAAALFLWIAVSAELGLRRKRDEIGESYPAFVSAKKFTLVASLIGYLYFYGAVIGPWLARFVPGVVVGLIWIFSAAALGNAVLWYFEKRRRGGNNHPS